MSAREVGGCDHSNTQQFDDGWECLDCKTHFFTEDPMQLEKTCSFCFDLLAAGTVHKQIPIIGGTECKATACPACHGRGVLPAAFEGWQWCQTCRPPEFAQ